MREHERVAKWDGFNGLSRRSFIHWQETQIPLHWTLNAPPCLAVDLHMYGGVSLGNFLKPAGPRQCRKD